MYSAPQPRAKCDAVRPGVSVAATPALTASQISSIVETLAAQKGGLRCTQRSGTRTGVLCPVLVWRVAESDVSEPIHAQLVNLSSGGVGLLCGVSLHAYEPVLVEMILAGLGHIQWKCSVRWCAATPDGICRIGAQLTDTTPTGNTPAAS